MNLQRIPLKQRLRTLCAVAVLTRPVTSFPVRPCGLATSSRPFHRQGLSHRLYSTTESEVEDDPLKWERMYQQQETSLSGLGDSEVAGTCKISSQIRVITFDLDDTLWKTGATIAAANDALAAHLTSLGIQQPKRVEVIMGELFLADKKWYAPVQGEDAKSPVLLTKLRKDAIAYIATEYNQYSMDDALAFADEAFGVWKKGRHDAIPSHLAVSVRDSLEALSGLQTADGNQVLIGAITDGNSDPSLVNDIGSFFDFCINAEQVGVGKPHPDVYIRAVQHVKDRWLQSTSIPDLDGLIDPLTWTVGPWWVHIGDDFIKDIVAAKDFRMRSVWSRELVLHKLQTAQARDATPRSSKSLAEFDKEISPETVVKMPIGSDDYLRESLENEFADGVVNSFIDLVQLLTQWHDEGLAHAPETRQSLSMTASAVEEETQAKRKEDDSAPTSSGDATKFCLFCGGKLRVTAKFCSSCGENQQ